MFCQVGALASSKSAMKTLAPELSALITILRSVGPVISTRMGLQVGGVTGTTFQERVVADRPGLGQEVGLFAGVKALLAPQPLRQQLLPAWG